MQYGHTTAYGKLKSDVAFVVRHSVTLTGLSVSTRYHYRVNSEDDAGNPTTYADLTFRTAR